MVGRRTTCTIVITENAGFAERVVARHCARAVGLCDECASVPDIERRCGADRFADAPARRGIGELDRARRGVGDRRHVPPAIVGQRHAVEGRQAAAGIVAEPCRSGKSLRGRRGGELVVLIVRPARRRLEVVGGIVSEGSAVGVGVRAVGLQARLYVFAIPPQILNVPVAIDRELIPPPT